MRKKRKTLGSLISTMVYLGGAVWLTYEATNLYFGNQLFKAFFVALGGFFSFLAVFRFQIQDIFHRSKHKKWK